MRLNAGENGDIFHYSGFSDLAHTPRIQDIEVASSLKNGIYEVTSRNGNTSAGRIRLDIPRAVEAAGLKEEGALVMKKANSALGDYTQFVRDILTGKIDI